MGKRRRNERQTIPPDRAATSGPSSPAISEEAVDWLLRTLGDEFLYQFMSLLGPGADTFFNGFQRTARNVGRPRVRTRLKRELARSPDFLFALIEWPEASWVPWRAAITALDEAWLVRNWRDLVRGDVGPVLVIAMVCDERPGLRRRGTKALARHAIWTETPNGWYAPPPPAWDALGFVVPPLPLLLTLV